MMSNLDDQGLTVISLTPPKKHGMDRPQYRQLRLRSNVMWVPERSQLVQYDYLQEARL